MKCAKLSAICAAELETVRRRLREQIPGLIVVGLVVVDEACDAQPGKAHVETQVTHRPDIPPEMRAYVMQSAADRVAGGGGTAYVGGLPVKGDKAS